MVGRAREQLLRHIEWDKDLETGEREVDEQHRALVHLFNDLLDAEAAAARADTYGALERLTEYVLVHFSVEEELMERTGYAPERIAAHRSEHRALTDKTRGLVLDYRSGHLVEVAPIVELLYDWLCEHIEQSDRALADHVRRQL